MPQQRAQQPYAVEVPLGGHPGQAARPGAPGQRQQHRLGLVVAGVPEQHRRRAPPCGDPRQRVVPGVAGRRLRPARAGRRPRPLRPPPGRTRPRGPSRRPRRPAAPSPPAGRGRPSPTRPDSPGGAPRRRWRRPAPANRPRRSRRPAPSSRPATRRAPHARRGGRRRPPERAGPRRRGQPASAAGAVRPCTRATQASRVGQLAELRQCQRRAEDLVETGHADPLDDAVHEGPALGVLAHLGVDAEQPAERPLDRAGRSRAAG